MTAEPGCGITLHTVDVGALRAQVVVDPPVVTGTATSPVDGRRWPVSGWFTIQPEPVGDMSALLVLARTGPARTLHGRLVLRLGETSVECRIRPGGRYPTIAGADRPPRVQQVTADDAFTAELGRLVADAQSRIADVTTELIWRGHDGGRQAVRHLRLAEQELRLGRFDAALDAIDNAVSGTVAAVHGAQALKFSQQRDRLVEALDRVAGQLAGPVGGSLHEAAELLRRRG